MPISNMNFRLFYIIIFAFFISSEIQGQETKACDNLIFIRNDNKTDISKFSTYEKYKLIDSLDEGCFDHKIIKDSADYFFIIPFFNSMKQLTPIWLKKTDLIRMAVRHTFGTLTLYSQSDSKSKISNKWDIDKWKLFDSSVEVLNCKKGWYRIKLTLNGQQYIGWAKEEELCSNPCTTCS